MRKCYYLYGHGGSGNHGCEALVRSTCQILSPTRSALLSNGPKEDVRYGLESCCDLVQTAKIRRVGIFIKFMKAYLLLKLHHNFKPMDKVSYESKLALATRGDIALSIGGDNYCYGSESSLIFSEYHRILKKQRVKTVLWGCSVEPGMIDKKMREDLSRYDLITARESITYEALKPINPNTILAPDPAFTLKREKGNFPMGLGNKPYIGINVSPLIQWREAVENITMENYRALIQRILSQTDRDIALIPHVVWDGNDDRIPLGQLYEEFQDSGRVYLVEDQNCMQLKDIISGCEFFIGARTHATIAAYSTCVPTLVVGYSVKARGIAKDLFGTEEGYVLPVQQLREKENLSHAFSKLYERKSEIKEHLLGMMPAYIQNIRLAKDAVEKL